MAEESRHAHDVPILQDGMNIRAKLLDVSAFTLQYTSSLVAERGGANVADRRRVKSNEHSTK